MHSPIDGSLLARLRRRDHHHRRRDRGAAWRPSRPGAACRRCAAASGAVLRAGAARAQGPACRTGHLEAARSAARAKARCRMIDICDFAVGPVAPAARPDHRLRAPRPPLCARVAPCSARWRSSPPGSVSGVGVERGDHAGVRRHPAVEALRAPLRCGAVCQRGTGGGGMGCAAGFGGGRGAPSATWAGASTDDRRIPLGWPPAAAQMGRALGAAWRQRLPAAACSSSAATTQ